MKTNFWGKIKKITALFTILTQVLLPIAGAEVVTVELQDKGIPTIAADKVVPSETHEVPRSAFDVFLSDKPLSQPTVQKESVNPPSSLQHSDDEHDLFLGNDPPPLSEDDRLVTFFAVGSKKGADLSLDFDSLSDAEEFVKSTLEGVNGGAADLVRFAEIDGAIFQVPGNTLVVSYENTDKGVTVYLNNEVKSIDGKTVATIDWNASELLLGRSSVQKHTDENDGDVLDAVQEGIWIKEHNKAFLEILGLNADAIKGIEITREERHKEYRLCMGPGCAVSYDVTVQLNDGRSFKTQVSHSWDHQWNIRILDDQNNVIGERHGSSENIDIIETDEYFGQPDRLFVINHLVSVYGFSGGEVATWLKAGLLKIRYPEFNPRVQRLTTEVELDFDPSLQGRLQAASKVDPLSGGFIIPAKMVLTMVVPFGKYYQESGLEPMTRDWTVLSVLSTYGENTKKLGYSAIFAQYNVGANRLDVMNRFTFTQSCTGENCVESTVKIVEVHTPGSNCTGLFCTNVFIHPYQYAVIQYPTAAQGEISKRIVHYFVPGQFEKVANNVPIGAIFKTEEFTMASDGKEIFYAHSYFQYEVIPSFVNCVMAPCPESEPKVLLARIERFDESWNLLSTITPDNPKDGFLEGRGYFFATIQLADGTVSRVRYNTLENLLQRAFEKEVKTGAGRYFDEQGRLVKEIRRDGTQIHYHHSDTGVDGVTIIDRAGNTTKVVFDIQGLTVPNARKIAIASLDLIKRAGLEDGAVIHLSQFSGGATANLTLRSGDTFYDYLVKGRKATLLSKVTVVERLESGLIKAFDFLKELKAKDRLTLQEAKAMNAIQARLKALIEVLPQDQWPAWTVKFNQYLDASDYIVATKSLSVILEDGRELLVRNHTDLFTKIIQRFKMMDQTGEINLARLAGIDTADLEGLQTFTQYISGRQIGEGSGLPLFDLSSPFGNLELVDRLVRKYAAEADVSEVEGPVDVIQDQFLRYVDGTQQAFDSAIRIAKNILNQYPVRSPSTPLTLESILAAFSDLEVLNSHLSKDIAKDIDLFRGEAVFKNMLINSVTAALGGNDFYRPIWERVIAPLNKEEVVFNIQGKDIRVSRADLDSFTNRLPSDVMNLSRYPGVKASIDSSFFATVMTQGYYNRLASVDLRNPAIPPISGTGNVVFSNVARRFQLLEEFIKTWPEVIRSNNTVDFDRLRFRLLISYELEIALGRAEEYLNGRIQAMQAFGEKKVITVEDYAAMKEMLSSTQAELALRFNPLLKDVIYDTTNEVTARIQTRFQGLVNSFSTVLSQVQVTVQSADGTAIVFDPKTIQNDVLNKILLASAIRVNGRFPREAFLRITGIDENLLSGLLSPEKLANLKNFTFYHYDNVWQGPGFANEEILFELIPALVQMFETADVQSLSSKMTEEMSFPVSLGESIETYLKNSSAALVIKARADMNAIDIRTLEDVYAMKAIFEKLNQELRYAADLNHDGVLDDMDYYAKNFSQPELAVLESWINWNWNESSRDYLSSYGQVYSLFQSKLNSASFLEVEGVRVPVAQIIAIAGFPTSSNFDRVLFPGLEKGDFESTESYSELSVYQNFRFTNLAVNPNDLSLSPLGRIEAAVHIAARLILSLEPSSKVFFVNAQGNREVNPNEFRKYIKGVEAMRQSVLEETRKRVAATAHELEAMRKGSYTIEEITTLHAKLLSLRSDLIQMLKDKANIHERQDVLSVENEVSQIFQKEAFELFVSIVGAAKLTVEIEGKSVTIPAKAITDALIAYLKTQKEGAIAAHDFATLYGISVADVRGAHKLENYLSEQVVALPKNSEFVQIVSQISEMGYMQIASQLVTRYAAEVVSTDGTVDVARLIELVTDKEQSVARIKQAAVDLYDVKTNELYAAAGQAFGVEGLNTMAKIMEDAKGRLVSMMNDFLSGNSDDALLKELEELVNTLYGKLKVRRGGILETTPFVYEVNGEKISILLNQNTIARFGQAVADWLAANPGYTPLPIWAIGGLEPRPMEGAIVLDQALVAVREVSSGMIMSPSMESISIQKPIGIWLPYPEQGNYNPGDHPTEFGLATLFARLAVKYSELAVDENGFNMDLFLVELQSTDASRAERRLQTLLEVELPALKDSINSLRRGGALPVEKIGEINVKFQVLKERIRVLGNDAQAKSIEVWQAFMGLYETSLFEGPLSVEVNGNAVVFEPRVLNDILLKLHKEGKLDQTLMKKFNEMINKGESTWQYNDFKSLSFYRHWLNDSFGFSPQLNQTFQGLKDESMDPAKQKVSFTLGDMVRLPGISAKDLNGLDVIEKDLHLRLTPVDPLKLMGLLDMRALAPGSGVSTGGLMAASMSADSMMMSSMKAAPVEIATAMRVEIMPVDRIIEGSSLLTEKSFRFVAFDLIPAMIKELGEAILQDGSVVPAYFSLALEGKLVDFLNQRSALLQAADNEITSLEAEVEGRLASILTTEQIAAIKAQIKEQVGNYVALSRNLQEILEQQGVSSETSEAILNFLKLQSEGGEALSEAALNVKMAEFMEALIFNNQQRQIGLNITLGYIASLKEYRAKIALAQSFEELMIPKHPISLTPSSYALEEDPRVFLESAIAGGELLLERAREEIKNWIPPVHKSVLIKNDLAKVLNQWQGYQRPKGSLLSENKESSKKVYSVFRPVESRKKKQKSRRSGQGYEETGVVLQPLQIAGAAASDAAMETWMTQMARGGVPDKE